MNEHLQLIELVKARPFLYDPLHHQYKNNGQKRIVWDEIASKIDSIPSGIVAKLRWRTLRDTYVKYLKNIGMTPPGQKKRWQYASAMEFLKPFLIKQQVTRIPPLDVIIGSQSIKPEESFNGDFEIKVEEPDITEEDIQFEHSECHKNDLNNPSTSDILSISNNDYLKRINVTQSDAVDLLLLSYAQTIKTFTERRQAETKMKIANIMAEAELADIEEKEQKNHS